MDVSEVCTICRELNSERTTERKKAAEKLKLCLGRTVVKKALDKNFYEGRGRKNFTWENVFRAVCVFVGMETGDLKHASATASKTTLTNRETRKQEASGLVKLVVRLADKGGPKLKGSLLFEHILDTLKDDFMCEGYGQDYCNIMLKNVLTTRKYIVELSSQSWHEVMSMFCKLFNNQNVKRIDKLVLARIINAVMNGLTSQTDVRPKKILAFFADFFSKVKARDHKSPSVLEQMLQALITLLKSIGPQSRVQICKLGEDVAMTMLYLWKNLAQEQLKDHLIEFLQIQMWAHHPQGERQGSPGAFAVDWSKWMSCLRSLYELFYREILEIAGKTKMKEFVLKPAYVDLAVDVCNQLFSENVETIDVTQQSLLATDTQQPGPSAKRRRLESNWESIRGFITAAGPTTKLLPWVQLITQFVDKYPDSLPRDEVLPYITCLSPILSNSKRTDMTACIMSCLESFVTNWDKLVDQSAGTSNQTEVVWSHVWSMTLRLVSLHHVEEEGYSLLSRMLEKGLVKPGREIWSMFVPSVSMPVPQAVRFLISCVQFCDLPESYIPKLVVTLQPIGGDTKFPLRKQLIDWLLPNREDEETDMPQAVCNIDPDWTSHTLVALTLRDPSALKMACERHVVWTSDLEKAYLEITLQCPLSVADTRSDDGREITVCDIVHIAVLLKTIEDTIQRDVQYYSGRNDQQVSEIEEMVHYAHMVSRTLSLLVTHHIVAPELVGSIELGKHLATLIKKITASMMEVGRGQGHGRLLPVLLALQRLYSQGGANAMGAGEMGGILRAVTPATLIDLCWDIVHEKHLSRTQSDSGANQSRFSRSVSHGKRARLMDDFDDDFDMDVNNQSNNNDDLDDDDGMDSQTQEESGMTEACPSLLSGGGLPESQILRLQAIKLLCLWCCHGNRTGPIRSEVDVTYTRSKVIALLKEDVLDATKPGDIQQLHMIVQELTKGNQTLDKTDLLVVISAIRNVAKLHRKDHELCCLCLNLLNKLVPSLSKADGENQEECRESAMHLVQVFCNLQEKDGHSTPVRLCLLRLIEQFIKYDPICEWSSLQSPSAEDSGEMSNEEVTVTPARMFIDYGVDLDYTVRTHVASALRQLFVRDGEGGPVQVDQTRQEGYLTQLYDVLNDCLNIQGKLSAERLEDEVQCRTASVLLTLATVVCVSRVCEKKAVFYMMRMMRESELNKHMTHKTLSKVASILGFPSLEAFLESHLPYLVHNWLTPPVNYPISDWPYSLLSCEQKQDFYRRYRDVIIPELVFTRNLDAVQAVAVEQGVDHKDLLRDCVPKTLVHILPLFAASGLMEMRDSENIKKLTKTARACYDLLAKELTQEVVDRQIVTNLEDVVVNILMCLYDPDLDDGNIANSNPEPNPPSYNTYIITSTLDYITKSFSGGGKTLVEILFKTPDSIQKILLDLATSLFTSHRLAEKRRLLQGYQLFVRLLLKQFSSQLGGSWAYVLREVTVRLVYLIKDMTSHSIDCGTDQHYREPIASMLLHLLRDVCVVGVESCPKELMKYLPLLTSQLITTSQTQGDIGEQSISLLRFLVLEKAKPLRSAILALNNFPAKPEFKDCSDMHRKLKYAAGPFTLAQEIEHFLCSGAEVVMETSPRVEGLQFLHEQLTVNKDHIVARVEGSMLSRLIQELLQMTGSSSQEVQLAACKCLGVIGPVNLNTISLPDKVPASPLKMALDSFQDIPEAQKYCKIFHCLNEYLMDKSVPLVQCTSFVVKTLLAVKTGAEFAAQYREQLKESEFLFHYLHPFRSSKKKAVKTEAPSRDWDMFLTSVDKESLWNPENSSHSNWVITLATTLITSGAVSDEILALLEPICALKSAFCELILPYLVHDILRGGDDGHREVLSRQFNNFFTCHCGQGGTRISRCQSVASAANDEDQICMNVKSVRVMLSVIQYLRQQTRTAKGRATLTPWDNNFWLELDYLQVAKAAQYCSDHFSTLLYTEIWCDVQRDETTRSGSQSQKSLSQDTRIDTLSEVSSSQAGVSVQDLLMEAYRWIGDPDGVYGCGAGRKADTSSRVCMYEHENQWDKAVIACDIQMHQAHTSSQYDVLRALQNFGASHIFETYLQGTVDQQGTPNFTSEVKELQFEASWKMGRWNIDTPNKLHDGMGYHECLYKGVKALMENDVTFTDAALDKARLCTVAGVGGGSLDAVGKLYPVLADLQCVNVLDTVRQMLVKKGKSVMNCLPMEGLSVDNDFEFQAPALYMGCTAWRAVFQKGQHRDANTGYIGSLQQLARRAREAGRHQICERAVQMLKCLPVGDLSVELDCQKEEAQLFWSRGEFNIAKHLARALLDKLRKLKRTDEIAAKFYPGMLSLYGNWLAETRSENPNIIMEEYLEKTVVLLEEAGDVTDTCIEAYLALARYADTQYQHIVNYMKSSTFEAKNSLMRKSKAEAERLKKLMKSSTKEEQTSRYMRTLEKQSNLDARELQEKFANRERFLLNAVEGYIKCLRLGDKQGLRVFRLASLWFSNANNEEVNQYMQEAVEEIQMYKWLPLMYQLAARMDVKPHGDAGEMFLNTLNQLIYKTAVSHPYHTLPCVMALANANRDRELEEQARANKRQGKMSKSTPPTVVTEGRIQAAKQMIDKLRGDEKVGRIVKEMQAMCDAYIQLANWNVNQYKAERKAIQLPAALWISTVKDLKHVPVLTRDIKVDPTSAYDNIAHVVKFQPMFKLAGGINLPKIITCLGSDGQSSRQLVKGRDDLRQDAVMQQVFEMVNNLLMKDGEARKRKLHIRKYKVVPLSQVSGVLEWCEGTQPIGEYLIGSPTSAVKGAHQRYAPKDWLPNQCWKHLSEQAGKPEAQHKAYLEACTKFQPVFRHFFLEKFPVPSVWFERRLAYTRSIATNSIVGYILGLGDRHVQNILIDCNSAELVHIDLGVAFEQGKILPVPETVPFRLTRDIEDAMGSCGVEGVFRRCCERTLEVMRTNQEAVLTILEVLLYDPLHVWSISPHKAYELQQRRDNRGANDTLDLTAGGDNELEDSDGSRNSVGESQENVNKLAERVLLRLHQKLQGVEDGIQLGLTGQVNHLIQEARNPKNLARIFPGWQPYI